MGESDHRLRDDRFGRHFRESDLSTGWEAALPQGQTRRRRQEGPRQGGGLGTTGGVDRDASHPTAHRKSRRKRKA